MSATQSERVVFPDEVEDAKRMAQEAAAEKTSADDVGAATEQAPPEVTVRNMITVPANCPEGFKPDANGVCREIMD